MTDPLGTGVVAQGELSHSRALDLLDEQRRRIVTLSDAVLDGRRMLQRSTAALNWRSASRLDFDLRIGELHDEFNRCSATLRAALAECDRARDLLRAGSTVEQRGHGWEKGLSGYPAGAGNR